MEISKIPKRNISDEVFEQMKRNIISGGWTPGKKIPSELKLSEMFGVSRISIRQAIHMLVGMGILNSKIGDGTYVSETVSSQYFDVLLPYLIIDKPSIYEVFEFRSILERKSAYLAAERATPNDILLLEEALKRIENNKDNYDKYIECDLNLHTLIASTTKNAVIVKISAILYDMLISSMRVAVEYTGVNTGTYYHTKIIDSIKNKDSRAAADFMEEHITSSMKTLIDAGMITVPTYD